MGFQLTFLNTSNAPVQGPAETKRMRAHVNKVNFAKRRQRLIEERRKKHISHPSPEYSSSGTDEDVLIQHQFARKWSPLSPEPEADQALLTMIHRADGSIRYLLCEFRPLVFPEGIGVPGSAPEAAWVHLLLSEPALLEASVAIGLKHYPRHQHIWGPREAAIRKGRAIKMINQRLDTPSALTDGLLSAVFTLTWAEHLGSDTNAMKIHIDGLAQMIRLRRSSGNNNIPSWLSDFLLYASMAHSIPSANGLHKQLIQALTDSDTPSLMDLNYIRSEVNHLRQTIDHYRGTSKITRDMRSNIEQHISRLQSDIDSILATQDHHIRTLRLSIQLFLLVLWPNKSSKNLKMMAEDLRRAFEEPHIRLCSTVDLPIWQLSVGATAASSLGETRSWYISRLRELSFTMNVDILDKGMASLEATFKPDACVLEQFQQDSRHHFVGGTRDIHYTRIRLEQVRPRLCLRSKCEFPAIGAGGRSEEKAKHEASQKNKGTNRWLECSHETHLGIGLRRIPNDIGLGGYSIAEKDRSSPMGLEASSLGTSVISAVYACGPLFLTLSRSLYHAIYRLQTQSLCNSHASTILESLGIANMLSPQDLRYKYPESNPANIHVRAWYLARRQPHEPHVQLPTSIKIDGKKTTHIVRCRDMNPLLIIVRFLLASGFTPTPEAEQSSLMRAAFHDFHYYENRYHWGSIVKGQLLADMFPERELDTEFKDRHSNLCDLLSTAAVQTHIFQSPDFLLFDREAKEPCEGGFRTTELSDAYNAQQSRLVYDGKRPLSESLSEFLDSRLHSHIPLMITVFPPFLRVCYDPASNEAPPPRRFDDLSTFTLRGWTRGPQPQEPQSPGPPGQEPDTGPPVQQEHNYILFMVVAQLRPIIPQQPELTYMPGDWRLGDPSHRYMLFYHRLDPECQTNHLPPRPPLEVHEMSPEELSRLQTRPPPAASEIDLHEQDNIQPPEQRGPSPDLSSITPE